MNKLGGALHAIDAISEWSGKIVSMLIFPIIGLIVLDVVMRYFFNAPIKYAHEVSLFMFAGLSLLAGAYCLRHRAHVRMDIIYGRFSHRQQAILDVITAGLFFPLSYHSTKRELLGGPGFVASQRNHSIGSACNPLAG